MNGAAQSADDTVLPTTLALVRQITSELHPTMPGIEALGADASIERDFGLDSLARVELALRIERAFGRRVPDAAIAEAETVRDLVQALSRTPAAPRRQPRLEPPAPAEAQPVAAAPAATLIEALEWFATTQAARTHILLIDHEDGPEPISFGALRAEAAAVAAGLGQRGVRPGEAVAIMLPTGREFFAAFYGALYAQAVPVPLYPPARPSQIESHLRRVAAILANCEARVLLTFAGAKRVSHLLRSLNTKLETVATVEEIALPQATLAAPAPKAEATAFLQYTSGSTGQPKGVVLTHANVLANLRAMQAVTAVSSADRFVSWLPLYHDMGLIGACFGALVFGFPLMLASPFTFLAHPARWLQALARHRATLTAAPNFAFELCLNKIEEQDLAGLDLSSLRLIFNGAETVSPQTIERFVERFAPCGLQRTAMLPVYGLAECCLGLTFPPPARGPLIDRIERATFLRSGRARHTDQTGPESLRIVSCGKALPRHVVRIVDAAGAPLPERVQGRIEFQGPSATRGYFHNPRESARLFDGQWLDSGDLGYLADGELYVTGRAKDIIIRGGHNIHPQELERAIGELSGARKGGAVVFPARDPRSGTERIVVVVETREQQQAARSELITQVNRLAVDLIGLPVDEVVLAAPRTVLKTSSGKIRRAACREAFERGELTAPTRAAWAQLAMLSARAAAGAGRRRLRRLADRLWGLRALLVAISLAPVLWLGVVPTRGAERRRRVAVALFRLSLRWSGVAPRVCRPAGGADPAPCVYVCNHSSYVDVPVLAALLPKAAFVAKREFRDSFLLGRLFQRLGCVFVERGKALEAPAGVGELEARLRAGQSVLVFPEGTFYRAPGLLPFHMGAFAAAAAAGVAVVPVALCGTRAMLPDESVLPRPTAVELHFGAPLLPTGRSWEAMLALRRDSRAFILEHAREPDLEQALGGPAQPAVPGPVSP